VEAHKVDVRTVGWVARIVVDMLGQGEKVEWSLGGRSELHRVCSVSWDHLLSMNLRDYQ
jgi:hypothetical protein